MNFSSGGPTSALSVDSCGLARRGDTSGDSRLRGVNDGSSSRGVDQVVRRPKGLRGVLDALERPYSEGSMSAEIKTRRGTATYLGGRYRICCCTG